MAYGTWERHRTSRTHFESYLIYKYKKADILANLISKGILEEYYHYLVTVKNCANNTTIKYLMNFSKILRKEHLVKQQGEDWILKPRHKSKVISRIPLLPMARKILDKYKPYADNTDFLLPVKTNQKMNEYLKEIGDLSGIAKNLTTHMARHTFATTVTLSNNVSIESVSKMLGHTNLAMTQKYARILDKKINGEMATIAGKY